MLLIVKGQEGAWLALRHQEPGGRHQPLQEAGQAAQQPLLCGRHRGAGGDGRGGHGEKQVLLGLRAPGGGGRGGAQP